MVYKTIHLCISMHNLTHPSSKVDFLIVKCEKKWIFFWGGVDLAQDSPKMDFLFGMKSDGSKFFFWGGV